VKIYVFHSGFKALYIHVKKHQKKESYIYIQQDLLYTEDTESICLTPPQTQDASRQGDR